ncbi:MAG: outer membrane beta-barrel protein, partial [bacterium]
TMNRIKWHHLLFTAIFMFLHLTAARSQTQAFSVHEIAPFLGVYAPDRFETSTAFGARYYYHIDKRYTVGVLIGFARARQDFLRRATSGLSLQPGSDRVFYHGARATYSFAAGKFVPYAMFHLGLTRLYDEQNFTYGFGIGTQVKINQKFSFRYEFLDYIFSSGRDRSAWTNKNIEVSLVLGYHL